MKGVGMKKKSLEWIGWVSKYKKFTAKDFEIFQVKPHEKSKKVRITIEEI